MNRRKRSFSTRVKEYACAIKERRQCCRLSLLYGLLINFDAGENGLVFGTALECAANLVAEHTEELTAARAVIVPHKFGFEVHITSAQDARALYEILPLRSGFDKGLFGCEYCVKAFLRGVFIACGSVTDPEKGYHLELALKENTAAAVQSLSAEMAVMFSARPNSGALYLKDSEAIEDFLAFIGAANASIEIMNAKISKEVRADINRITNCETANIDKAASASAAQLEAIRRLTESGAMAKLPAELQETARIRLAYPEMSLKELCGRFEPPLSKSGLHHRLKRLVEAAE